MKSTYPAKVLLFGEYSILFGAKGLVIPFPKYFGQWSMNQDRNDLFPSAQELIVFLQSLKEQKSRTIAMFQNFKLDSFAQDLSQGLYFASNIPQGMGLGSSGALCAAIWDRYLPGECVQQDLAENRSCLALIEAFYHHSSSGLDPVVSYYQKPMSLQGDGDLHYLDDVQIKNSMIGQFYLLNSGIKRQTAPLVQLFKNKLLDAEFKHNIESDFVRINNEMHDAFLLNDKARFEQSIKKYSEMQLELFPEYFPVEIKQLALEGLSSGHYSIKLCGAGGGGMYLVYLHGQTEHLAKFGPLLTPIKD
jgi:mevalonate kinase